MKIQLKILSICLFLFMLSTQIFGQCKIEDTFEDITFIMREDSSQVLVHFYKSDTIKGNSLEKLSAPFNSFCDNNPKLKYISVGYCTDRYTKMMVIFDKIKLNTNNKN